MRRALISDIHGNLVALEAALKDCTEQKVDEIVCLGDICGYGPDPIECVDLIRARCTWVLCGNHDTALFMTVPIGFNKYAREAIEYHRTLLRPHWLSFPQKRSRWNWLQNLPASRTEGDALYVHASPRDPLMEYVEEGDFADMGFGPSQKAIEIFEKFQRLSFCGHSHRPGVVTDRYTWMKPHELSDMSWKIEPNQKTLVNVGSVGQPRDNNPHGCYVIYDTTAETVTYRRVAYDVKLAQSRFANISRLDFRLAKRLETGN
jgi:predicted phosphodiesterase